MEKKENNEKMSRREFFKNVGKSFLITSSYAIFALTGGGVACKPCEDCCTSCTDSCTGCTDSCTGCTDACTSSCTYCTGCTASCQGCTWSCTETCTWGNTCGHH